MRFYFIDREGNYIFGEKSWQWADNFYEDKACVKTDESNYAFIDKTGNTLYHFSLKQQESSRFSDGMAVIELNRRWGFINANFEIAFKPQFFYCQNFYNGYAIVRVKKSGSVSYMNRNGEVSSQTFDYADIFDECGLAYVDIKNKCYFINMNMEIKLGPYEYTCGFNEGLAHVKIKDRYAYIDQSGNIQFYSNYDYNTGGCFDSRIDFKHNGKCGYLDKNGDVVIPAIYDNASIFDEGKAIVEKAGKHIVIDLNGNELFKFDCQGIERFDEGLAPIKINDKYGYINSVGDIVIKPRFLFAYDFHNGTAVVVNK